MLWLPKGLLYYFMVIPGPSLISPKRVTVQCSLALKKISHVLSTLEWKLQYCALHTIYCVTLNKDVESIEGARCFNTFFKCAWIAFGRCPRQSRRETIQVICIIFLGNDKYYLPALLL